MKILGWLALVWLEPAPALVERLVDVARKTGLTASEGEPAAKIA